MAVTQPHGKDVDARKGNRPSFYYSVANLGSGATFKTPSVPVAQGVADSWIASGQLEAVLVQGMVAGVASAANGVKLEQSIDGVSAHHTTQVRSTEHRVTTIADGDTWSQAVRIFMPFWRFTYTNGAGTSTTLINSVVGITIEDYRDLKLQDLAIAQTQPTAGVATAAALALNLGRKFALFINDSDTDVYLGIGVAAVLNRGVRINANGGSYTMSVALGNLDTRAINSISTGATKQLLVLEGVE